MHTLDAFIIATSTASKTSRCRWSAYADVILSARHEHGSLLRGAGCPHRQVDIVYCRGRQISGKCLAPWPVDGVGIMWTHFSGICWLRLRDKGYFFTSLSREILELDTILIMPVVYWAVADVKRLMISDSERLSCGFGFLSQDKNPEDNDSDRKDTNWDAYRDGNDLSG